MTLSTANSTTATTPSASLNSLASLQSIVHTNPAVGQEDALQKASSLNYPLGPQQYRAQLPQDMQELKEDLHLQHLGSRYRMEGILWRKHLLERSDKKAQHRAWRQLLVVLDQEQGTLSMFRSDGTLPQIQPPQPPQQAHHHQGHYQQHTPTALSNISFADTMAYPAPPVADTSSSITNDPGVPLFDEIPLQHTITNILPPPGYSSSRKHVFAVQLYSGAVYLFQAKTPQECEAWARTCNYWAARTSKEPLAGGVVNMEYGWGRALDLVALSSQEDEQHDTSGSSMTNVDSIDSPLPLNSNASTSNASTSNVSIMSAAHTGTDYLNHPPSSSGSGARTGYFGGDASHRVRSASIKSGTRGSTSSTSGMGGGGVGINTGGPSNAPLGDRITLFDWTAPMPAMSRSLLSEEDQMLGLRRYVAGLESEMEAHQEHRSPMTRLFPFKSHNYAKAFNNWERRSQHLLKEMIKYQIYVECLEQSLFHFQQMLQDLGIDRLLLNQEEVEEKKAVKAPSEGDGVVPPQRLLDQIEENECPRDSVEAELERLVVHEGLASAIS
ncbi:hypothetical protein BGZ70_003143 [Mortierella alpina]|uniref:PH domain-containing protein n=1 Tax=Mortierella alpina TaxID=64518 RepID=A0A9P6ISW3_MORAP|nr:hypothetical protein BGZ70_003143 [Mortierella alpina]